MQNKFSYLDKQMGVEKAMYQFTSCVHDVQLYSVVQHAYSIDLLSL